MQKEGHILSCITYCFVLFNFSQFLKWRNSPFLSVSGVSVYWGSFFEQIFTNLSTQLNNILHSLSGKSALQFLNQSLKYSWMWCPFPIFWINFETIYDIPTCPENKFTFEVIVIKWSMSTFSGTRFWCPPPRTRFWKEYLEVMPTFSVLKYFNWYLEMVPTFPGTRLDTVIWKRCPPVLEPDFEKII